ncbi:MAG: CRISPR-associated protein Cas4 [Deltaproteobacteria bacterium]|nr:CRISPR-associated protein Cas4 [Deltaproteobacteria bacterium]
MLPDLLKHLRRSGLIYLYYVVCKRKLWLFYNGIQFAKYSDHVIQGKALTLTSLANKRKEIRLNEQIVLDRIDLKTKTIIEIKKSNISLEAHKLQVLYYLYYLDQLGLTGFTGVISYPRQFKRVKVGPITDDDKIKIEQIQEEIDEIVRQPMPPRAVRIKVCKGCSHFEFCWA